MILTVMELLIILDWCPNQPETYNGFQDKDGCPDDSVSTLDSDMDGIPDVSDACPLEPETYNFYQDDDGCPDSTGAVTPSYTFPDADGDGIDDRKGMHVLMNKRTLMDIWIGMAVQMY